MIPITSSRDLFRMLAAKRANQRLRQHPGLAKKPSGNYLAYLGEAYARIFAPEIASLARERGYSLPVHRREIENALDDARELASREGMIHDWSAVSPTMREWFDAIWWMTLREKGIIQ